MDLKLQTETPTLRNLGRNKRLLWRLSDELNTFQRNKTIRHAEALHISIAYFSKQINKPLEEVR